MGTEFFKVLQETDQEQLVEVVVNDEDYPFVEKYTVRGNTVIPRYFMMRNWGNTFLFGILGAIVFRVL